MTKTTAELDKEVRAAVKLGHGDTTTASGDRCNTCGRPKAQPFRRFGANGKVVEGCVDAAHTGHLYGESLRWHMTATAKAIRAAAKERLRSLLSGSRR